MRHIIAYSSPAGSTRHVAEVIGQRLRQMECTVLKCDLARKDDLEAISKTFIEDEKSLCLWVGSPVYVDHAVPPVEAFLRGLPSRKGGYAVPFVTWGGVSSGVALLEMGQMLEEKGFLLLGAAKVVATHSSMWQCEQPLGMGHPDENDDAAVKSLVDQVLAKLAGEQRSPISLSVLDYLPPERKSAAQGKNIGMAKKMHPEFGVDASLCTQCGICAENCPAHAISLDPYPRFGNDCFACWSCARICPESAIILDLSSSDEHLRNMARQNHEKPPTQIFF